MDFKLPLMRGRECGAAPSSWRPVPPAGGPCQDLRYDVLPVASAWSDFREVMPDLGTPEGNRLCDRLRDPEARALLRTSEFILALAGASQEGATATENKRARYRAEVLSRLSGASSGVFAINLGVHRCDVPRAVCGEAPGGDASGTLTVGQRPMLLVAVRVSDSTPSACVGRNEAVSEFFRRAAAHPDEAGLLPAGFGDPEISEPSAKVLDEARTFAGEHLPQLRPVPDGLELARACEAAP